MTKKERYFDCMEHLMRHYCHWYDLPDTILGKLEKAYNLFRILFGLALVVVAASQLYFYGISYVLDDSAVFLPLGIIGVIINFSMMESFPRILNTSKRFESFFNSFTDNEKQIMEKRLTYDKRLCVQIMHIINFYLILTPTMHLLSVSLHSFFGFFSKPILLPVIYEKFLGDDLEVGVQLIVIITLTCIHIRIVSSLLPLIMLVIFFLATVAAAIDILIARLDNASEKAEKGSHKLNVESNLSDTIQKHADLLSVLSDLMDAIGFPASFLMVSCSILFCLNAITLKQTLKEGEFSSFGVWGTFLLVTVSLTYIMSSRGQEIEIKSDELVNAVYNLPWYRESLKSRRKVLMMILQGNRMIKFDFKGLLQINMQNFSEMIQTSYSYFMLLSSFD